MKLNAFGVVVVGFVAPLASFNLTRKEINLSAPAFTIELWPRVHKVVVVGRAFICFRMRLSLFAAIEQERVLRPKRLNRFNLITRRKAGSKIFMRAEQGKKNINQFDLVRCAMGDAARVFSDDAASFRAPPRLSALEARYLCVCVLLSR